jgi:hypothetical protein
MDSLLKYAALVLSLAISLYTVYSIVHTHVVRRREARALAEEFRIEFGVLIRLTSILRGRVGRFYKRYAYKGSIDFKTLNDQGKLDLKELTSRIDHILGTTTHWDLPKIGATLNGRQMDFLVEFLGAFQHYRQRLELWTAEFRNVPDRNGAFGRMLSAASLNDVKLSEKFIAFQKAMIGRELRLEEESGEAA